MGDAAPDFELEGSSGRIRLAEYQRSRNVAIFFMREFGWMTCRGHVASLGRINQELKSHDTDVLVIGGGSAAAATKLGRSLKLPFPVLADPDRAVYGSFGLDKRLFIQRSATVLIDKNGTIRYILRATNPRGSFDKEELLKAISTL